MDIKPSALSPSLYSEVSAAKKTDVLPSGSKQSPDTGRLAQKTVRTTDTVSPLFSSAPLEAAPQKGLQYFFQYPAKQLTRLIVDGALLRAEKGAQAYERREPGCLDTLIAGWNFIGEKLSALEGRPQIDIPFIKQIHQHVAAHNPRFMPGLFFGDDDPEESSWMYVPLSHVSQAHIKYFDLDGIAEAELFHEGRVNLLRNKGESQPLKNAFCLEIPNPKNRTTATCPLPKGKARTLFLLKEQQQTDALLQEFREIFDGHHSQKSRRAIYENLAIAFQEDSDTSDDKDTLIKKFVTEFIDRGEDFMFSASPDSESLEILVSSCLDHFNRALLTVQNGEQLFNVLCSHISELIKLHPFTSVNGRTFNLLTQFVLMAFGLPPATFENPGMLLCGSHASKLKELKNGVEATKTVLSDGNSKDFSLHDYVANERDNATFQWTAVKFQCQRVHLKAFNLAVVHSNKESKPSSEEKPSAPPMLNRAPRPLETPQETQIKDQAGSP